MGVVLNRAEQGKAEACLIRASVHKPTKFLSESTYSESSTDTVGQMRKAENVLS